MAEVDVLTESGFRAIAEAFGEEKAWEAKIAKLWAIAEENRYFRWFSLKWERQARNAEFELMWLRRMRDVPVTG